MNTKDIVVTLAEKEMAFRLHFTGSEVPFLFYGGKKPDQEFDYYISAEPESIREYQKENTCSASFAEYSSLLSVTGNILLHDERMLFHGVGMIFKGIGYIMTAPSGTGKSTQFRNLHTIYGDECRIINGDKPVVRYMSENEHRIYPSPWNGKENWAGTENAVIKAIIWLEQGVENRIERTEVSDMVLPIFNQVLYTAPDTRTVHEACRMIDSMLAYIPIYRFVNTGDLNSSTILGEFLESEAGKRN